MTDRWELTEHVCAICLGRALYDREGNRSRCSNCGVEGDGKPKRICCCGIKLKNGKDAGIRCIVNPAPTPEMPAQIVATEVS